MKWSVKASGLAGAVVVSGILLFQNCAQPMQQVDTKDTFGSSLAFAFQTQMDTFAYMSCAGAQAQNPSAIWTMKLGALAPNSGVQLLPTFFDATSQFSDADRATLLTKSPENAGAVIQVAMREIDNVQSIMTELGSAPTEGKDYFNLLTALDNSLISTNLIAAQGLPLSYFGALGAAGRMEAVFRMTDSEGLAQGVRNGLSSKGRLMVTYKSNNTQRAYLARGPGTALPNNSAYGRSLQLQFTYPVGDSSGPRIVSALQENDLLSGAFLANWICGSDLRFRIGKNASDCPSLTDSDPTNSSNPVRLGMVRRVLGVSDWAVNLGANCVLQKGPAAQCYNPSETGNHYLSICNRNL